MTPISKTVLLPKAVDQTWAFLNNSESVGKCLPGCQEVRIIDGTKSYWKVKISVGIVSRIVEVDAIKKSDEEKRQIAFHIRSKSGDLEGDLQVVLLPSNFNATKLDLTFDVRAVGAFSWIINQMIGKQSDKMASQFVDCVNSSL